MCRGITENIIVWTRDREKYHWRERKNLISKVHTLKTSLCHYHGGFVNPNRFFFVLSEKSFKVY